jgi:hypothetical protein
MACMNEAPVIGFIGFGEAAFHIAKGLRQAGVQAIVAFDIHSETYGDTAGRGELIRQRAEEAGAKLVASNAALAAVWILFFPR